jgi:chromosome segregation ATPase
MAVQSRLLLWLGAGQANLSLVELNSFDSIVLVEARKEECVALEKQFKSTPNVQIVHALIDLTTRELNFNRRSLAEFSSIADATGILELFPSLTTIKVDLVTSLAIGELIESVTAGASDITLVIDLPDLNADLLSAILEHQNLKNMYELILPMPELALFKAAVTQSDMKYIFEQHGFDESSQDTTDPDIPYVQFKRNHLWASLNDSKLKLHESESSLAIVKIKYDELILENQLHLEQLAANELDLAQKEQQLRELSTKAERELSESKKAFDTDRSQLESKNSQLMAKNAEIRSELENEKSAAVNKIDELQSLLAEMTKQRDQQTHWHQENKKWAETLKSKNEKLETDAAQKQTIIEQFSEQVRLLEAKQVELIESLSNKNALITELTEQQKQNQLAHGAIQKLADSLKIDNDSLNADVLEKQTLIEQLLSQTTVFETKQDELIQSLSYKDAQITDLTEQKKQNKQVSDEIQKLADSLKVDNESLSADVLEKQTLIEQLLSQATVFETKQDELIQSLSNKDAQITELTEQQKQNKQASSEIQKLLDSLKIDNDSLNADISEKQALIEQLLSQAAVFEAKQDELIQSLSYKDAQITELTEQQKQAKQASCEIQKLLDSLKIDNDSLNADISEKQTLIEQLLSQAAIFEAQHNEASEKSSKLQSQLVEIKKQKDEQAHWHQENKKWAEALKSKNEKLESNAVQKQTIIEELSKQVSSFETKQKELNVASDNKQIQIDEINLLFEQKIKELTASQQQITELQNEKAKNETNLARFSQSLAEANQALSEYKQRHENSLQKLKALTTVESELKETVGKVNELKSQLTDRTKQRDEQAHWHQENKKWAEGLNKKVQTLEGAVKTANDQQKDAFQTLGLNTKLMTKLEMDNGLLRKSIADKHAEIKQLKGLIGELHQKLQLASKFYLQVQQNYPELIDSES